MAWIESHQELARHPKTKKFSRIAGISLPAAIGHLHMLWWWAMDYAQDGDLTQWDAADISDAILWDGNPDVLLDALLDARFIDRDGGSIIIHDWWEYAGKLMEIRRKDKERKRNSRGKAVDVQPVSAGHTSDGPQSPCVTQPNTIVQNTIDGESPISSSTSNIHDRSPAADRESDSKELSQVEKTKQEMREIRNSFVFSDALSGAANDWIKYKHERRDKYKPQGLKQLLSQIQNNAREYGEDSVIQAIRDSMASNYKGIVWDKAKVAALTKDSLVRGGMLSNPFLTALQEMDTTKRKEAISV